MNRHLGPCCDLAALRMRWALVKLTLKAGFDPSQPRLPRGANGGGQWVGAAGGGGGSATDAAIKPRQIRRIARYAKLPADAVSYFTPDGSKFFAPPNANFEEVFRAGQNIVTVPPKDTLRYIADNVGQFGRFDFQRDGDVFHADYTDASNYAAGLFMSGAGFSYPQTIAFAGGYAAIHSSGGVTSHRVLWWTYGYMAGALRSPILPLPGGKH